MPKLGLRPYATIEAGLDSYVGYNFQRIENVFERMEDVVTGSVTVTGSANVQTSLAVIDGVLAGFLTDPSAAANYVVGSSTGGGVITIRVLTSTFALSTTPVSIRWVALGELVLS